MQKGNSHSVNITVKNNLCIGCGLCKVSCNYDAIKIGFNKNKEYVPYIDEKCTECGSCYQVCPMSFKNLNSRINKSDVLGLEYGLTKQVGAFKGYEINYDSYIESSSGGILTALVKYLLENNIIDCVIHAKQFFGNKNTPYFKASISKTTEEIDNKRSSFYYPIEFSEVIEKIKVDNSINSVAFLALPCVLSGLKNLKQKDKVLRSKIRYTFALICSHNASAQFADCIVKDLAPKKEKNFKLKFRDKVQIPNAANFNNSLVYKENHVVRKSRNKSPFTLNWRTYSYSLKACMFCPDFWGVDADAGFKDAWGLKLDRKEGETAFYINQLELKEILYKMQELNLISYSKVPVEQLIKSQKDTLIHKTTYIKYKQNKHRLLKEKRKKNISFLERLLLSIDFKIKSFHIKFSKFIFRTFQTSIPKFFLKIPAFIIRKVSVYLSLLSILQGKEHQFEVLYTAGFGYKNIGDEAQLSTNLSIWKDLAPNAKVTLMSPNPEYTRMLHGNYEVIKASRNCFWGFRGIEYAGIGNSKLFRYFFKYKFIGLKVNAFFIKNFNTSFFISPESSFLLKRLKNANVLHIGGGGYLTGKTFSRLYDYMGLIHLACYFKTDVILSGHNIGIWQNKSQRRIAKQLKKVKLIGLRDSDNSIKDLKEINVFSEEKVFANFDDALFCNSLSSKELDNYLKEKNLNIKKYIIVNAYYSNSTEIIVKDTLIEIAKLLDITAKQFDCEIVLLPMHSSDIPALEFLQKNLSSNSFIINEEYNFKLVISLIQNAEITITMRHHPIIFSMAGKVPTLSIVFDDYFKHKNIGAMKLFGQENHVYVYKELFNEAFIQNLISLLKNRDDISNTINGYIERYESQKGFIIKKYLQENASYLTN